MQAMAGVRVHPALEPLFNLVIDLRTKSGEWTEDMKPHITSHHSTCPLQDSLGALTWCTRACARHWSQMTTRCCTALLYRTTALHYCTALLYRTTVPHYCTAVLYCTALLYCNTALYCSVLHGAQVTRLVPRSCAVSCSRDACRQLLHRAGHRQEARLLARLEVLVAPVVTASAAGARHANEIMPVE